MDSDLNFEGITVRVNSSRRYIVITNVYNRPGAKIDTNLLGQLFARKNCVIVGDFNSFSTMWGSPHTDVNGGLIEALLDSNDCVVLNNGEGTYIKRDGGLSHLDLSIVARSLSSRAA
jgi:hypothetical protein